MSEYVPEFEVIMETTCIDPDKRSVSLPFLYREGDVVLKDGKLFGAEDEEQFEEFFVDGIKAKELKSRMKKIDDLKNGDIIYSTWYDGEPVAMVVESIKNDKKTALGKIDDGCYGNLYFCNDFRKCWTCSGYMFMNLDAITKMEVDLVVV